MNLDKALDELNRAPNLATPSLPALAYLLRHPEMWPEGFVWSYYSYTTCAVGLAAQVWHGHATRSWIKRTFDLDYTTFFLLFCDSGRPDHRPTDVATRIDHFLATTEGACDRSWWLAFYLSCGRKGRKLDSWHSATTGACVGHPIMSLREFNRLVAASHEETAIERLEAATEAVYNCALSDGDPLAVLIHNSDYVDAGLPMTAQLERVKSICRVIAKAALDAADVGRA